MVSFAYSTGRKSSQNKKRFSFMMLRIANFRESMRELRLLGNMRMKN